MFSFRKVPHSLLSPSERRFHNPTHSSYKSNQYLHFSRLGSRLQAGSIVSFYCFTPDVGDIENLSQNHQTPFHEFIRSMQEKFSKTETSLTSLRWWSINILHRNLQLDTMIDLGWMIYAHINIETWKLMFNATVFHCVKYDVLSYLVPHVLSLSDCRIQTQQRHWYCGTEPNHVAPTTSSSTSILFVCVTDFVWSQFGETRLVGICRAHPWFTATLPINQINRLECCTSTALHMISMSLELEEAYL